MTTIKTAENQGPGLREAQICVRVKKSNQFISLVSSWYENLKSSVQTDIRKQPENSTTQIKMKHTHKNKDVQQWMVKMIAISRLLQKCSYMVKW